METIFDYNITREEFDEIFGDTGGATTYENYLSLGFDEDYHKYHLSQLFWMRGEYKKSRQYRKQSGMPPASDFFDYFY